MRPSDTVLRRVMGRRHKGRRPAAVVDHIKADDGPDFEALESTPPSLDSDKRLSHAVPSPSTRQSILSLLSTILPVGRGITPEKFMNAILTEGSFEAYLELARR
jgi:hypothetical protein